MRLWLLDTNLVVDLTEGVPERRAPLIKLAADADDSGAFLAISSVTVQEYLVIPRTKGDDTYHRARKALDQFIILQFDRRAAEEASKLELARYRSEYLAAGASSRSEAKQWWFRDAAIVGTAIAFNAEYVFTREGPMLKMEVVGPIIRSV